MTKTQNIFSLTIYVIVIIVSVASESIKLIGNDFNFILLVKNPGYATASYM